MMSRGSQLSCRGERTTLTIVDIANKTGDPEYSEGSEA